MNRFTAHLMMTCCFIAVAPSSMADSVDAPYAAQQCTKYDRPKPKNVRLTDADARKCCAMWAEDEEKSKQKAFAAECTKRVIEFESQKSATEVPGAGGHPATSNKPQSPSTTTGSAAGKAPNEDASTGSVEPANQTADQAQPQNTNVQNLEQGMDVLQSLKGLLR